TRRQVLADSPCPRRCNRLEGNPGLVLRRSALATLGHTNTIVDHENVSAVALDCCFDIVTHGAPLYSLCSSTLEDCDNRGNGPPNLLKLGAILNVIEPHDPSPNCALSCRPLGDQS